MAGTASAAALCLGGAIRRKRRGGHLGAGHLLAEFKQSESGGPGTRDNGRACGGHASGSEQGFLVPNAAVGISADKPRPRRSGGREDSKCGRRVKWRLLRERPAGIPPRAVRRGEVAKSRLFDLKFVTAPAGFRSRS